jgi:hypothetical protein
VYRSIIRVAHSKDPFVRDSIIHQARAEFRGNGRVIKRSDYQIIEYNIRRARKQLKIIQMPGFRGVN